MARAGRLAPSPTGALHAGNARSFLLAWLAARSSGALLLLRMEDIDSPRVKPGAAAQALEDLRWLGLDWDEGPDRGGPHAPYVQTERLPKYQALLDELRRRELVYPCTCTRKDVREAASAPHEAFGETPYPGVCSQRQATDAEGLGGPYCWRFRMPPGADGFDDLAAGPQRVAAPAEHGGDFVVWKSDGGPAYQLAVVADDHAMGITEVVRGADLLASAFRQRALFAAFGWTPPQYAHVPLVVGADGRRLAKRHGDTRLATFRAAGVPPERLVGALAWTCGLRPAPTPCRPHELLPGFSWERLVRTPTVWRDEWLAG